MTQEHDHGFPYEILGGSDAEAGPAVNAGPVAMEPVLASSNKDVSTDPFFSSVRQQLEDGSIQDATTEWLQNNLTDITTTNGFTSEQIARYNRLLVSKANPIPSHLEDNKPQVETKQPESLPVSVVSPKTESRKWSMPYNIAKKESEQLGRIIDAWRSGDSQLTAQLMSESGMMPSQAGVKLNPSEVVGLKEQIDAEIREMEDAARDFVKYSPEATNGLVTIDGLIESFKEADSASKRKEIRVRIEGLINSGVRLSGTHALGEASGLAVEILREELGKKKEAFQSVRKIHETTHEEVLNMLLRDKEVSLEEEIRSRPPEDQYKLINHLLVELEEGEKGATLDLVNQELKQQLFKLERWVADSRAGIEQPMSPEVARLVEARLNLDHTYKVIARLNLKHPQYGQQLDNKDFERLDESGRLLTPEQTALVFGWVDNGLGIPLEEMFGSFERIAMQRSNRTGQEVTAKWDLKASTKQDRILLFESMDLGDGVVTNLSDDEIATNMLMIQRAAIIWGMGGQADTAAKTQLGKLIHTRDSRTAARLKAKGAGGDFGPEITIDRIMSIATDGIRFAKIDGEFIFAPESFKKAITLSMQGKAKEAAEIVYKIMAVVPGSNDNLYWGDERPNIAGLPANYIKDYWTTQVKAAVELGEQILNNKWVPGDLGTDTLQKMRGNIGKIDPTISYMSDKLGVVNPSGVLSLARQVYIGIVDASLKEGVDPRESTVQGWLDEGQLGNLDNRIVDSGLLDQDGLDGVYKTVNFEERIVAARAKQPRRIKK